MVDSMRARYLVTMGAPGSASAVLASCQVGAGVGAMAIRSLQLRHLHLCRRCVVGTRVASVRPPLGASAGTRARNIRGIGELCAMLEQKSPLKV